MWVAGRGDLPGHLVVVSGPSGSGKSTVLRRLISESGLRLELSVSATTRTRRIGENDGIDYHFLSREGFIEARDHNDFLEWAEYNGQLYGTPAQPVYDALAAGRSVLLEIEVQGAHQVREAAPSALFVFIRTPTFSDLERRLRRRGTEDEVQVLRRLRKARLELAEAHWYDVQIVNDDLDRCVAELAAVLRSQGCG